MAATRFRDGQGQFGRRKLSAGEITVAISVIAGLSFVVLRVMNMGVPEPLSSMAATGPAAERPAAAPSDTDMPRSGPDAVRPETDAEAR
jgi:hypothetical protein